MPAFILLLTGFIKIFCSPFSFWQENWWILAATGSIAGILLMMLYRTRIKKWIFLSGCGLLFLTGLVGRTAVQSGYNTMANEFLCFLTGKTGKIYLDFPAGKMSDVWFFTGILLAFLVLIFAESIERKNPVFIILLTGIALTGNLIGFLPLHYGWLIAAAGILCFVFSRHFEKMSPGEAIKTWTAGILISCLCVGIAVPVAQCFPIHTKQATEQLAEEIHRLRYDTENDGMPEGNLSELHEFEKNPETALKITMEKPQKLYLRGMTGERYTGHSWEPCDSKTRIKNESLFYWLHQNDFFVQSMISGADRLTVRSNSCNLTIKNISACREHLYLPYALADNDLLDERIIGGGTMPADSDTQKLSYCPGSVPEWQLLAISLAGLQQDEEIKEYLKQEQSYRDAVYEDDLQITNAVAGACKRISGDSREAKTLPEILSTVQELLDKRLEYNELSVTHNGKIDFFSYVMEQSKTGYSVHYATAATLLLRYFGVPARYVEGYFISEEEASAYHPGEEILLSEAHAHAWTEYYLDGVGWIPFEVTPGYIDEEEIARMPGSSDDASQHENNKTFEKNPLVYSPPEAEDAPDVPESDQRFHLEAKQIYSLLILLLLTGLGILVIRILIRKRRLHQFLRNMEKAQPREAVTELFAYAAMLQDKFQISDIPDSEEVMQAHQEARFSHHDISEEQKEMLQVFTNDVVLQCKKKCNFWSSLWYQHILSLYR